MRNLFFTIRTLKRSPLLTFVGIPGLAVGLTALLLLVAYLSFELSFDKHFKTKDRVIRVVNKVTEDNGTSVHPICLAKTYDFVLDNVPGIEAATRIYRGWGVEVARETQKFTSVDLIYADPGFFNVFGKPLLIGDAHEALNGAGKVVLTESTATRIFGSIDCVGEKLEVEHQPATVTGVIGDFPVATHFSFDVIASMESTDATRYPGLEFFTYFLIDENYAIGSVSQKIIKQNNAAMVPWLERTHFDLESKTELLSDIHLHTSADYDLSAKGNIRNMLTVGAIAFFILLIALINFINLYVLHGETRIGEISTRRSFGAGQSWLARLFYTDAAFIGTIALGFALVLTMFIHPWFANLIQSKMALSDLFSGTGVVIIFVVLLFIIGTSGSYPLYFLSCINILSGLRGKTQKVKRKSRLSILSLVVQFVITIFLLGSLYVMNSQLSFLKSVPLGFEANGVLKVDFLTPQMRKEINSIENELTKLPFVQSFGSSFHTMGGGCSGQGIRRYGTDQNYHSISEYRVQPGFAEVLKLKLIDGRFFKKTPADSSGVILNESAARMLGIGNKAGEVVDMGHGFQMHVLGVVNDFYYNGNSGQNIQPLALTNYDNSVGNIYLRTSGGWNKEKKQQIERVLKQFDDTYIFNSRLISDIFEDKYYRTEHTMRLVSAGALLTILLSLSGLIALSLLNVQRKTKEIGVRKVLGSNELEVMQYLMQNTLKWILISMVIASAAIYYFMQEWLSEYVNKINLTPKYFLLSGLIVLLFAAMSISWQSWRAATQNPVEALRYE